MERIGVLGTGAVGQAIASKLVQLGYEVKMGSRSGANESARDWASRCGPKASQGTFAEAAAFGELLFLCLKADAAPGVLEGTGPASFRGKTLVDVTNPLDFSHGMPPTLFVANTDSMGEQVQRALPEARVVKSLNMVNAEVQANPDIAGGESTMFMAGNDEQAKQEVRGLLEQFGWRDVIDLGDISGARGMEMLLPLWLRLRGAFQDNRIGWKIVRPGNS